MSAAVAELSWACALCDSSSAPSFTRKSTLKEHMKRKHKLDDAEAEMILSSITDSQTPAAPSPVKQEHKAQRKPRAQPSSVAAAAPTAAAAPQSSLPPSFASAHVPMMDSVPTVVAAALVSAPAPAPTPVAAAVSFAPSLAAAAPAPTVKQEPAALAPAHAAPLHVDVAAAPEDTPMASEPLTPLHTASTPAAASVSPNRMAAKAAALKRRTPATQRRQAVARAPLSDEEEEQEEKSERDEEDTPMESALADSPTKQETLQQSHAAASATPPVQSQQLSYDPTMPPPPPSPARRFTPTNVPNSTGGSSINPPALSRVPSTPSTSPAASTAAAAAYSSSSAGISPAVIDALAVQPPTIGSCHHCKNMRTLSDTVQCSSRLPRRSDANGRRLPICTKRFCWPCLQKNYPVSTAVVQATPDAWSCPACEDTCFCIKCKQRLAALGRAPGDPTVVQPPKPLPPPPPIQAPMPAATPASVQRKESTREVGAASARKSQGPAAAAAAPTSHAAPSLQQPQPQIPPPSVPIRLHPPHQLVLSAGTELSRVSPPTECHALVVQLCEPHTLSVVVRLTPELTAQQSVYPECSVHFPLPGCPLWMPPGAAYRICNLAMDEPQWTAAPKVAAENPAEATMAAGESKSNEPVQFVQTSSTGSIAVVEIWVQSTAPSAAETAATREMVSDRLASLQAHAQKLRAEATRPSATAREYRDDSASDSSDASDDDEEYGGASNRKRKRGASSAAASKHARAAPAAAELQLIDNQIADLQAYLEGYAPAMAADQQQQQQCSAV